MAQTISGVTAGATTVPFQAGVPRLLSSYDPDAETAAALASSENVASLRIDLEPLVNDHSMEVATDGKISSGYAGAEYRSIVPTWPSIRRHANAPDERGSSEVGGAVGTTVGAISVVNERAEAPNLRDDDDFSGRLDPWVDTYIWDQRPVTLSAVAVKRNTDEIVAGPLQLLKARTKGIANITTGGFQIELGELIEQLQKTIQTVRLKGTGGVEGGPELAGVRPRIILGSPLNVEGLLVSSTPYPTYLLGRDSKGRRLQGIAAGYVGMNPLSPAQYVFDAATNTVQVTSGLDATKRTTWDVIGAAETGVTPADFFRYVLTDIGPLSSSDLDPVLLSVFSALAPFRCGWVIEPDDTYVTLLDKLLKPWAWWGHGASGKLGAGILAPPDADFVDYRLPRDAIRSVTPLRQIMPRLAVTTGYSKNWTQVTEDGVAAAARSTERGKWSQQPHYRLGEPTDETLYALYPSSDPPQDYVTPLLDADEALVVHRIITSVMGSRWRPYRVVADARAVRFEPNRVIAFSWPRWDGVDVEATFRIQSAELTGEGGLSVTLNVWGPADVYVLGADGADEYFADHRGDPMRII